MSRFDPGAAPAGDPGSAERDTGKLAEELAALFSRMGYELRTPMTAVMGALELLTARGLGADEQLLLGRASEASRQLLSSLDGLLQFGTLKYATSALAPRAMAPEEVLERVRTLVLDLAQHRPISFFAELKEPAAEWILVDAPRLEQVVAELVARAMELDRAGAIEVTLRVAQNAGGVLHAEIFVEDSGGSVSGVEKQRLLWVLEAPSVPLDLLEEGMLVGLAAARRIVELMGGELGLVTRPNGRNQFWASLPLLSTGAPNASLSAVGQLPLLSVRTGAPARPPRVLIAEDNPFSRELLLRALHGYQDVATVGSGRDAVKLASTGGFDVVLMDCQLPDIDGIEATRLIRGAETGKRAAIIAITASVPPGERDRCLTAGMDAYMAKPFDLSALRALVELYAGPAIPEAEKMTLAPQAVRMPLAFPAPEIRELDLGPLGADRQPVDLTVLRKLGEQAGSSALVIELSEIFLGDTEQRLVLLEQALVAEDRRAIQRTLHTIRGAAGSLGAFEVARLAAELEARASTEEFAPLSEASCELKLAFAEVSIFLRERVLPARSDTLPSPRGPSLSPT